MALGFLYVLKNHECTGLIIFLTKLSKYLWIKTGDRHYHFVEPWVIDRPFCRMEIVYQSHFVETGVGSLQNGAPHIMCKFNLVRTLYMYNCIININVHFYNCTIWIHYIYFNSYIYKCKFKIPW